MSLFSRIFGAPEQKASPSNKEDRIFFEGVGSYGSKEFTSVSAALRAGMVIASDMGMMPLKSTGDADLDFLLNDEPFELLTAVEFKEMLTLHAVFSGAGRAYIRRDALGKPTELIPIHPSWTGGWVLKDGEYVLPVSLGKESIYGDFTRDEILEVTSPRWDMTSGLDVTRGCNKVLGLSRRLQDRQAQFADTKSPYGVLFIEAGESKEGVANLKKAWAEQFGKTGIAVVDMDGKFQQMFQTSSDQQLLETMKFQVEEVARVYGVHPYFLMQTAGSGAQGAVSDAMLFHASKTMGPWIARWEAALNRSVMKRTGYRANFDENALMRTTPQVRAEISARALGSGGNEPWMTPDEVRQGKNPFDLEPKGDDFWKPKEVQNETSA